MCGLPRERGLPVYTRVAEIPVITPVQEHAVTVDDLEERIRVQSVEVLSNDWYLLKKTTFDFSAEGWDVAASVSETYDRGQRCDDPSTTVRRAVILTRAVSLSGVCEWYRELADRDSCRVAG